MKRHKGLLRALFGSRGRIFSSGSASACRRRNKAQENRVAEQLEKRLALTNNYYQPAYVDTAWDGTQEENWTTVYSDGGSDIYLRHAPTIDRALFLADNGGFQGEVEIADFNAFNQQRTSLVGTEGTESTRTNLRQKQDGAVFNSPYVAENTLLFPFPYQFVDLTSDISGTLTLSNGRVFGISNTDPTTGERDNINWTATEGGVNLPIRADQTGGPSAQTYGTGWLLSGSILSGLGGGENAVDNTLQLNFDIDNGTDVNGVKTFSPATYAARSADGPLLLATDSNEGNGQQFGLESRYQVIDMTPNPISGFAPVYSPGTLRGTVHVDIFGYTENIDYQVNQIAEELGPDNTRRIPVSFQAVDTSLFSFDRSVRSPIAHIKVPHFNYDLLTNDIRGREVYGTDYRPEASITSGGRYGRSHIRLRGWFYPDTGELGLLHQYTYTNGLNNNSAGTLDLPGRQYLVPDGMPHSTRVTATAGVYRYDGTNRPVSFTMYPGLDHQADLTVALPTPGSSVDIESPILARGRLSGRGDGNLTNQDNPVQRGDGIVSLSASTININAPIEALNHFLIPSADDSLVRTTTEVVEINAAISSDQHTIVVDDDPRTTVDRSRVVVSASGALGVRNDVPIVLTAGTDAANPQRVTHSSLPTNRYLNAQGIEVIPGVLEAGSGRSAADRIYVKATDGDVYIEGLSQAGEQGYHLVSSIGSEDESPYVLTTNSRLTGVPTGTIAGDIATLTLGNDTLGPDYSSIAESRVDLRTDVNRIRFQAGPRGPIALGGLQAKAILVGGSVVDVDVINGGLGHPRNSSFPVVFSESSINEPRAEGTAYTDANGVITRVEVTEPGAGYSVVPDVTVDYQGEPFRMPDPLQEPYPYSINIDETDDLIIDAVASSSGPITVTTGGSLDLLAAVKSRGDIVITTGTELEVAAPLTTVFGTIDVSSSSVTVGSPIRILDGTQNEEIKDIRVTATAGDIEINSGIYGINGVALRAQQEVFGDGRIFGDVVEVISETGGVQARTDANIVYVKAPGETIIQEIDAAIFEIRDSPTVRLSADGRDTPRNVDSNISTGLNGFEATSPAILADIYGTTTLSVSAPHGSVDVLHMSPGTLTLIDDAAIGPSTAAGSVTIRSTLAAEINVNDMPTPTSSAVEVRFATSAPLNLGLDGGYLPGAPGTYATDLIVPVQYNLATGEVYSFGGINHKSIRAGDRVLIKDGKTDDVGVKKLAINGVYSVTSLVYGDVTVDATKGLVGTATLTMDRDNNFDQTEEFDRRQYYRVQDGALRSQVFVSNGFDDVVAVTPITVESVPVKAGFAEAEAVAEEALSPGLVTWNSPTQTVTAKFPKNIGFDVSLFDDVVLGLGDLVVLQEGVRGYAESPGLFEVTELGDSTTPWELQRYRGVDEDGQVNTVNKTGDVPAKDLPNNGSSQITNIDVTNLEIDMYVYGVNMPLGTQITSIDAGSIDAENGTITLSKEVVAGDGEVGASLTIYGTTVEANIEASVVVNQGSHRTALTGEMYQIKYDSMHTSELPFQQITDYRGLIDFDVDNDPAFHSGDNFRLEVGSDNPAGNVEYTVTSEGGTNISSGSLGKMLTALQKNTAVVERSGLKQAATFDFQNNVREISLEQGLPLISEPMTIDGNGLSIFGGNITTTRDGATVRTGSLLVDVGPVRPSRAKVARRLVRNVEAFGSLVSVHGFEVGPGSDGIVLKNMTIGGFGTGAGVRVTGTNQVLLENLEIGETAAGELAPNKYGVLVQSSDGKTGEGTTILGGSVEGSTEAGIRLDAGTDGVRIVNVRVGADGRSNKVGIEVDSATGLHMIGVAPILPDQTIANLPVELIPDESDVLADQILLLKNTASDILEQGAQLFDRVTGRLWEIESKVEEDELNYRFTVRGVDGAAFTTADVDDGLAVEAGFFVQANGRTDTLVLPAGVPVENLYLGQRVTASVNGVFPANARTPTRIAGISEDESGVVTIELDREILDTAFTAVQFDRNIGATGFRNNVGFNEDGIVLASGSSRMVRTDVHDSVYDGIRIEGVATSGSHEIGGTFGDNLVQMNNAIYGNQLTGIRFAESFFAGLGGSDDTGNRVSRVNQVAIRGNFLSTTIFSGAGRTNGISGVSNLVFDEPNYVDDATNLEIQNSYVNSTARTTETIDGVVVERYTATYRPEDDPTNAAFAEIGGRDLAGNFHYSGIAAVIDDSIGGGPVDGGGGSTGDGTGTGGTGSGSWSPGTR